MGELAMVRSRVPFSHLNMVMTLGCPALVDDAAWDSIDHFYGQPGAVGHWVLVNAHSEPGDLVQRLLARGYTPDGAWERVVLQGVPGDRWATHALVGRRGWMHAIRREGGRPDGRVVMARSLYQDDEGWAWLGVDAPVPGVMAPCFEDDQRVTATLLAAAAERGARAFVSDIELPCDTHDSEAYQRWGALGFEPVYRRELFTRVDGG